GFEEIFSRQIKALVKKGDLVVAISTSGNSPNVLAGVKAAKKIGAATVGLTGQNGGRLKNIADLCLRVPSNNVARIQECHQTVGHIICEIAEKELSKPR
ncbi:MAG: SIS domain-containing protein, partial [Planctomycetota bacterium]